MALTSANQPPCARCLEKNRTTQHDLPVATLCFAVRVSYSSGMILALLLLAAQPVGSQLELETPRPTELDAAKQRDARRLKTVLTVCRAAVKSGDVGTAVTRFANSNGLSAFGRLSLLMDCRIYEQGLLDGSTTRRR